MRIPRTFQAANRLWRVRLTESTRYLEPDQNGITHFDPAVIYIRRSLRGDLLMHTFCHELLHVVTDACGQQKLNRDEDTIDSLAGVLHQALKTSNGRAE